jgi:hypothetical protein
MFGNWIAPFLKHGVRHDETDEIQIRLIEFRPVDEM